MATRGARTGTAPTRSPGTWPPRTSPPSASPPSAAQRRGHVHPRRRAAGAAHQGRAAQARRAPREAGHPQMAWTLVARCSGGRPLPLPRGCGGLARPLAVHCYAPLTASHACGCRPPPACRVRVRPRLPPAARPPFARRLSVRHRLPPESNASPSRASEWPPGARGALYRARIAADESSAAASCLCLSPGVCSHETKFSQ
jgi:hypothetical protein